MQEVMDVMRLQLAEDQRADHRRADLQEDHATQPEKAQLETRLMRVRQSVDMVEHPQQADSLAVEEHPEPADQPEPAERQELEEQLLRVEIQVLEDLMPEDSQRQPKPQNHNR